MRAKVLEGNIQITETLATPTFLANYAKVSDEMSNVPFWKPLGIYTLMLLAIPILVLAGPILLAMHLYRKIQ